MENEAWEEWSVYHATLFRMADDLPMIQLWRETFEARGYSAGELREASMNLATHGGGRWRTEHLEAILDRVAHRRLARLQESQAEEDRRHAAEECKACFGAGLISVPHPACIRDHEWVYPFYECAVACRCYRGCKWVNSMQATIEAAKDDPRRKGDIPRRIISIGEYEMHYSGWESQMQLREIRRETERSARQATAREDKRRGPLAGSVEQLTKV